MQTLQILDGADTFLRPLDGRPIVLGAAADADVRLASADVAPAHARVEFDSSVLWIHALDGTVRVNGRAVGRAPLALGDRIELGAAVVVVGQSVARQAEPDDVLGSERRVPRPRRAESPLRQAVVGIAVGGFVVVAVLLFAMLGSGRGSGQPAGFADLDRLRRAGSFELAAAKIERLRADWAGDAACEELLATEADRLQRTQQLVQDRRQAILTRASTRTYAEFSDELQRIERIAPDEDVRIAAGIVRASLSDLLRTAVAQAPQPAQRESPARRESVQRQPVAQQEPAARPGNAGDERTPRSDATASAAPRAPVADAEPVARPRQADAATGAPVAQAPVPAPVPAQDRSAANPQADQPDEAAGTRATVSGADVAAVLEETRRLVVGGQFRQGAELLQLALAGANAADAALLQERMGDLRRSAKTAADKLVERARAEQAQGRYGPMIAELNAALARFPTGSEFAPLPTLLDLLEREQREKGDAGRAVAGGIDEATRRASLVAVAAALADAQEGDGAGDWSGAAAALRPAIATIRERDPGYALELQARLDDFEALAELQARIADVLAGGKRVDIVLRSGQQAQLRGIAGHHLVATAADGDRQIAWADLAPVAVARMVADARLDNGALFGAAALLYRLEARKEAEAILGQLLARDAKLKERIDRAVAHGRGDPVDPRGYRFGRDGFVAVATIEAEKVAGKVIARLDAAVRSKDPGARAQFVTDALALGPAALDPIVDALHRVLQKEVDQLERSGLRKQLDRLAEQRTQLDQARAFAKELIFDEVKYFYPYAPPQVSSERFAEYNRVQAEVDRRVAAVRAIWDDEKLHVKVPAGVVDSLLRVDWIASTLRDVGEIDDLALLQTDWVRALPAGSTIGIRTYCRTVAERRQFEGWQQILALDAVLSKQLDAGEREQMQITNDYRVMFGHRPLAVDLHLRDSARGHADEMSKLGYFSHFSPTPGRRTPGERMNLAGYHDGISENIALTDTAASAHAAWCRSSGHHRNLLMATHTEFGTSGVGRYWVQNFGIGTGYEAALQAPPSGGR